MKLVTQTTEAVGPVDHFPTDAEVEKMKGVFLARLHQVREEHRAAAVAGLPALGRLCEVLRHRSGQSYKIRNLLYSMWAGTPTADLSDVNGLDWELRKDFCAVLLAFGYEDRETKFFYSALEAALASVGQLEWFRATGDEHGS